VSKDLTNFPISYVSVVIGYETTNGIEEVVQVVDGKRNDILSCELNFDRKTKQIRDKGGSVVAHEATGEQSLSFKVKYVKG
jgi:hypothetical protein